MQIKLIIFFYLLGEIQQDGYVYAPGVPGCKIISVDDGSLLIENAPTISSNNDGASSEILTLSGQSTKQEKKWTDSETLIFLEICKEIKVNDVSLKDKIPHKWQKVSDVLHQKTGNKRCKEVCKNKWGRLKADYLKWKTSQSKTGQARTDFKFQSEIDEILGDSHYVQPKFLITASGTTSSTSAGPSTLKEGSSTLTQKRPLFVTTQESPSIIAPPAKTKKLSFECSVPILLEKQNALLEENKQQMQHLSLSLQNGLTAIADSIRYLAECLPRPS